MVFDLLVVDRLGEVDFYEGSADGASILVIEK